MRENMLLHNRNSVEHIRQQAANWSLWLYGLAVWLLIVFALRNQRAYQDSWILEDIVAPFLFLLVAFVVAVVREKNGHRLALLVTSFLIVLRWIPGFKYIWAYGTAVDQSVHITNTQHMMQTGFPPLETVYTNVPGIHLFLSSIALVSGTNANDVGKYALPILMGLMPLLIYFLLKHSEIEPHLINNIIIATSLAFDPYFLLIQGSPIGTLFSSSIFIWFFSANLSHQILKLPLTIILISFILILPLVHSISSLIIIGLLVFTFVISFAFYHIEKLNKIIISYINTLRMLILLVVFCLSWWVYQARGIFSILVEQTSTFILQDQAEKLPVPSRIFQLSLQDTLTFFWILHANIILVFLLSAIGLVILWYYRRSFSINFHRIVLFLFIIQLSLAFILGGQLLSNFGNLEYFRIMGYAVALSPFFVGVTLWYIHKWNKVAWTLTFLTILFLSLMQVFPYQPIVPKADALGSFRNIESIPSGYDSRERSGVDKRNDSSAPTAKETNSAFENTRRNEPILYLHTVTTNYNKNLLFFAEKYIKEETKILSDRVIKDLAYRFWGDVFFKSHQIGFNPSPATMPLDSGEWEVYLLHYAGFAGPLSEPVEFRSRAEINRIISEPKRSLIYSNGEAFVLIQN